MREHLPNRRGTCTLFTALLALAVCAPASATELRLPTDPTLAKLIEESLAARPELAQSLAVADAQRDRVSQIGTLPDPMLQIGIQNDGFTSLEIGNMATSFVSVMASQTLPWPGKLALRKAVAELGASRANLATARVRLSTEAEVRRFYLALLLARERLGLLSEQEALLRQASAVVRVRYEAGDGVQADLLRVGLELSRLRQRRVSLQTEERIRLQALNRLRVHALGDPVPSSTRLKELSPAAAAETAFSFKKALELSPELAAARLAVERVSHSARLAEKGDYPDLTVGAGIMFRGQLPPMWQVTLGGPLPVYRGKKQQRAISEQRAWARAASSAVRAIEQTLQQKSEERRAAYAGLVQTIALYEKELLVESQAGAVSSAVQYQVGRLPFAAVLEAHQGYLADQEAYLEAVAAAQRLLIAELELKLGESEQMAEPDAGPIAATM